MGRKCGSDAKVVPRNHALPPRNTRYPEYRTPQLARDWLLPAARGMIMNYTPNYIPTLALRDYLYATIAYDVMVDRGFPGWQLPALFLRLLADSPCSPSSTIVEGQ